MLSGRSATRERLVRLVVVGWQIWGAALVHVRADFRNVSNLSASLIPSSQYTGSPDYVQYIERVALQNDIILRPTGLYRRVDTESEFAVYDALGEKYRVQVALLPISEACISDSLRWLQA